MKKEKLPIVELSKEDKKSLDFLEKRNNASVAAVKSEDKSTANNEDLIASREAEIKAALKKRKK